MTPEESAQLNDPLQPTIPEQLEVSEPESSASTDVLDEEYVIVDDEALARSYIPQQKDNADGPQARSQEGGTCSVTEQIGELKIIASQVWTKYARKEK